MAALMHWCRRFALRCVPDSLFGRLALLLGVAVLSSHFLALTLMFELMPSRPPPPGHLLEWAQPGSNDSMASHRPHGPPPAGIVLDIGVRLGALLLAAWVGARWLSEPIRRLASAARDLGHNIHRAPLPEVGTLECRQASRVFNQMQEHIQAQMEQRDQFVAAVSHDLRTPLTRLALRAESLSSDLERRQFKSDISEMDTMIRATLDYLSGAAEAEPWVMLDLNSLVRSLVHDQQEIGNDVQLIEPQVGVAALRAQPSALRRCIGNLIDNGVRYGGSVEVCLIEDAGGLVVQVIDAGPGIPEPELRNVFKPFYRLEGSRNRNTGGCGLGLAIASDIAHQHHGFIRLQNRKTGGLCAELVLGREGQPAR